MVFHRVKILNLLKSGISVFVFQVDLTVYDCESKFSEV